MIGAAPTGLKTKNHVAMASFYPNASAIGLIHGCAPPALSNGLDVLIRIHISNRIELPLSSERE